MSTTKITELLPVYLLVGDDEQKKETLIARMKQRCAKFGEMSINTDVFDASSVNVNRVISTCLTLPFASNKRLVILNNLEDFSTSDLSELASYVLSPSDSTILLLVCKKLNKNSKLYKNLNTQNAKSIINCEVPKQWEFKNYAKKIAKSKGVTLEDTAAQILIELVGNDTVAIANELEKIINSHSSTDAIDSLEVKSLVSASASVKPWVLVDAFSAKNAQRVLELLPQVTSITPTGLLAMCVNRVRELICAKKIEKEGGDVNKKIAIELGLAPAISWRVKNHASWSRLWSNESLKNCIFESIKAEKQIKSGENQITSLKIWLIESMSHK